jgi:hypothetical protein
MPGVNVGVVVQLGLLEPDERAVIKDARIEQGVDGGPWPLPVRRRPVDDEQPPDREAESEFFGDLRAATSPRSERRPPARIC